MACSLWRVAHSNRLVLACVLLCGQVLATEPDQHQNWPMWRADAQRSAASSNELPSKFELLWQRRFAAREQAWDDPLNLDLMTYDRVFEPIVMDGLVLLGFNDQDKLLAMDAATGRTRWTFFTEAPVRLPPVGWQGKVYFCADDGFLYCVNLADGRLVWKFDGAPNAQHALGNQRLTSAWPARGGPVLFDGQVYFAASIWPFMGTFLYALDAETGQVRWVNDSTGAQYIKQPHSAPSFAGVAPQGALVATEDLLIVPGGRSVPAVFDRPTGALKYFEINAGGKGTGGSFVTADANHYYVHTREKGTRAFNLDSGLKTAFMPNEPVLAEDWLYSAESVDGNSVIRGYRVDEASNTDREPAWELSAGGLDELIMAGQFLVAAQGREISIIELAGDVDAAAQPRLVRSFLLDAIDEPPVADAAAEAQSAWRVARLLVADRQLLVVGTDGALRAYGMPTEQESSLALEANRSADKATPAPLADTQQQAVEHLLSAGDAEGYAFWFGPADAELLWSLSQHSPFEQLAVVDSDAQRVADLRVRLDHLGLHGRVTVHPATPQAFRPPQYVANMVFVSEELARSPAAVRAIYAAVRPYGGALVVPTEQGATIRDALEALQLEQAQVEIQPGQVVLRRAGALPGSADWTHQYGDVANTIKSDDQRVKLPLGILWFGGSSNMDVLPRHGHGPPEQVVGGRLFIQGMNSLSARDVYTGRVLWKREFEDLGTFDVYYDATYENTPLNPQYNQVHIPGANGRGTNYVVTEDRVYLLVGAECLMLDPATGQDVGQIQLPRNADDTQSEWGYLGIVGDVLLGGVGFAEYRQRYELEFDADKQLKSSRAGFGSKSFDRAASRGLVAFDRHTGKVLWKADAKHSFWHNGIVAGGGRVYCLDKNPTQIEQAMRRRGLPLPDSYRIVCFDVQQGKTLWEIEEGIFGTWLGYSAEHELLLQAGAQGSDRLYAEVGQGMRVYEAGTGELRWKKDDLNYAGPCILHNDLIITNANSYSESAGAFYLTDGSQKMVQHPITKALQPWKMTRAYGCNNIIASENLLTFRSGAAGYYDLLSDSGTGNLGGFKSGCTSNLVVANGVLNAPDYTRTCSCAYQNQTSLALVHMPGIETWAVNALAKSESSEPVDSVGFNFGAAGDRRDATGTLWLEYPVKAGESAAFEVEWNPGVDVFQQHSLGQSDRPLPWVASSGIEGVRELKIHLSLERQVDLATGVPVASSKDDAEEASNGETDLGSSDLELVHDDGDQLVGVRFAEVALAAGAKVKEAYIQFTCDEPSDDPTSLNVVGELAASAAEFSPSSHDLSFRRRTQSEVVWTPPAWKKVGEAAEAQRTPNLAAIVQEIVDQPDWQAGSSMAFLIGGSGKRTAVASRGTSKESAKLIVIADQQGGPSNSTTPSHPYFLEIFCASPRGSTQERVFDVYVGDTIFAENVRVPASNDGELGTMVRIAHEVQLAEDLHLRFESKQGPPVLCGLRLERQ